MPPLSSFDTVQHESTGPAGAFVTTSSSGMSSSINKELFQRGDDDQLVSQKWTTSTTFRWYVSHRCHIHCVYHSVWYVTVQCRRSPLSQQVNVLAATTAPQHQLILWIWWNELWHPVTRVELMVAVKLTGPVLLYGQFSEITESHKQLRLISS